MIGRAVGRFRIIGELGRGGMAQVWKAEDTLLGRHVALKILSEELARSSEARRRFLREARTGSRLDHPGVPTVFDYGESGELVYMAQTLIDGDTLAALATRAPMPIEEAVRIVARAARILGHAHASGVLHRDVTGRNIMIARDGRVFVLDFGLALAAGDSRVTSTGTTLGTLSYLAPEVLDGRPADARSDLYGLGVVLYEALTGWPPFAAERREATIFAALHVAPPSPRGLRPDIPEALEALVLKAMARAPEDRFQSADELAEALEAFAEGGGAAAASNAMGSQRSRARVSTPPPRPVPTPPPVPASSSQEATRVLRRTGRGTVYLAVLPFEGDAVNGGDDSSLELLARGLAESLGASLARLPGVQVIPPGVAPGPQAEHGDPRVLARRLGANLLLRGSVGRTGARVHVRWDLFDPWPGVPIAGDAVEGLDAALFDVEDRLAGGVRRALGFDEARAVRIERRAPRDPAAHERYLQALGYLQRRDSEAAIDGALGILERLLESEGESAQVLAALGRARLEKYRVTRERSWESRAAAACQRALELDPEAPEVLATLGEVHFSAGRYDEAVRDYQRALDHRPEMIEALLGLARALEASGDAVGADAACHRAIAARPGDWRAHSALALLDFNRGRYAEATGAFRRVIELTPDNPRAHNNLGSAYYHLDRLEEAMAAYRASIAIQPTARAFTNLGAVLFVMARYEESAESFEKATALSPSDPILWGNLGSACRWIPGREARAAEALDRAIALMGEQLERNPHSARSWAWLSAWLANRRRDAESIAAIEKALALAPEDVHCLSTAGSVYNLLGDPERALHSFREAVRRGYGVEKLRRDPELAPLRENPEFIRILEEGSAPGGDRHAGDPMPGGAP